MDIELRYFINRSSALKIWKRSSYESSVSKAQLPLKMLDQCPRRDSRTITKMSTPVPNNFILTQTLQHSCSCKYLSWNRYDKFETTIDNAVSIIIKSKTNIVFKNSLILLNKFSIMATCWDIDYYQTWCFSYLKSKMIL